MAMSLSPDSTPPPSRAISNFQPFLPNAKWRQDMITPLPWGRQGEIKMPKSSNFKNCLSGRHVSQNKERTWRKERESIEEPGKGNVPNQLQENTEMGEGYRPCPLSTGGGSCCYLIWKVVSHMSNVKEESVKSTNDDDEMSFPATASQLGRASLSGNKPTSVGVKGVKRGLWQEAQKTEPVSTEYRGRS